MKLKLWIGTFLFSSLSLFSVPSTLQIENLTGVSVLTIPPYQTGIDGLGYSVIAYPFHVLTSTSASRNIFLQTRTLDPNGTQVNISPAFEFDPSFSGLSNQPLSFELAVSLSGNSVLVWTVRSGSRSVVMASFGTRFGAWDLTQLTDGNFNVTSFNAAIDESGNVVVAWSIPNGRFPTRNVVQAAYRSVDTGLWQIPGSPDIQSNVLSDIFFNVNQTPAVGIANGNATVAWQIFNGIPGLFSGTNVVQAAFKSKFGVFQVFNSNPSSNDISPTNPSAVISTFGFRVASAPIVTAYADTAVITWQVVGNPNTTIPDNTIQAFVKHF